jgi:hypothetical protein
MRASRRARHGQVAPRRAEGHRLLEQATRQPTQRGGREGNHDRQREQGLRQDHRLELRRPLERPEQGARQGEQGQVDPEHHRRQPEPGVRGDQARAAQRRVPLRQEQRDREADGQGDRGRCARQHKGPRGRGDELVAALADPLERLADHVEQEPHPAPPVRNVTPPCTRSLTS